MITWVTVTYYALINRIVFVNETSENASKKLAKLESSISMQFKLNNEIISDAQKYLESKKTSSVVGEHSALPPRNKEYKGTVIPVLVFACNRVSVSRCLDQLIQYRPNPDQFPIIVSQVSNFFAVFIFYVTTFSMYLLFWLFSIYFGGINTATRQLRLCLYLTDKDIKP